MFVLLLLPTVNCEQTGLRRDVCGDSRGRGVVSAAVWRKPLSVPRPTWGCQFCVKAFSHGKIRPGRGHRPG